jgi:hypothetical protein
MDRTGGGLRQTCHYAKSRLEAVILRRLSRLDVVGPRFSLLWVEHGRIVWIVDGLRRSESRMTCDCYEDRASIVHGQSVFSVRCI